MRITTLVLSTLCGLSLSACGDTFAEQSLIGAGAGTGTAVLLDQDPLIGGVLGAAGNVAYCNRFPEKC